MDVESPYEGTLLEWTAEIDTILPIGGEVARMEVSDGVSEAAPTHAPAPAIEQRESAATASGDGPRNANIPPRTRAYAKEKGLSDDDLAKITAATGKMMPTDVDVYLSGSGTAARGFTEAPVSQKQRLLASRLVRGSQLVVPGTISVAVNWEPIEQERGKVEGRRRRVPAQCLHDACLRRRQSAKGLSNLSLDPGQRKHASNLRLRCSRHRCRPSRR